jgi:hypothetical protein
VVYSVISDNDRARTISTGRILTIGIRRRVLRGCGDIGVVLSSGVGVGGSSFRDCVYTSPLYGYGIADE